MEVGVDTGLVFPLVRVEEGLADAEVFPCVTEEEEEKGSEAVLATAGEEVEEDEEDEEEGGERWRGEEVAGCVVGEGGILEMPVGEGRMGRE